MEHHKDNTHDNDPPRYFQVPPETYNYLIHALLSLQASSHPYPLQSPWPPPPPSLNQPIPGTQSASPSQLAPSTSQVAEGPEDAISVTEDKRRRNTAASARFRVKKKLRSLSLERTVSDLTERTEELEREATDLRRENAWLKEIILLKGRNLLALNTESQASTSGTNRDDEGSDEGSRAKGKGRQR